MREFSAQELKAHLESCDEQPLLLDVRQPWEYEVCKIEDSVLLPMSQITAEYNSLDFDRETVVICHHGIRSRRVGRRRFLGKSIAAAAAVSAATWNKRALATLSTCRAVLHNGRRPSIKICRHISYTF